MLGQRFPQQKSGSKIPPPPSANPPEFVVYSDGIVYQSVCSSLGDEETLQRMQGTVSGTSNGWQFAKEPFRNGEPNPCPCDQHPETHKHYLFET